MFRRLLTASIFAAGVSFPLRLSGRPRRPLRTARPGQREKKLLGAALNSFMKKCDRDVAAVSCEATAVERKLRAPRRRASQRNALRTRRRLRMLNNALRGA